MKYIIYEITESNIMKSGSLLEDSTPYELLTRLETYASYSSHEDAMDAIRKNRYKWKNRRIVILPVIEVPWDETEVF